MKKVLSLVLALSLVLGTFSMAFAANYPDVTGESFEDAVTVLSDLGVVSGYEDGTYGPEKIVTRAEMAVLVVRALGYDNLTAGKSSFTDMANYGWAEPYISYAQSLGVISGYGDGTFKPGNTVSYDEAATMLVAALGYTTESLQGTWPANYGDKAKTLGIMDGVPSGSAGANRGNIATMVYQTLDQAIGKVNKDGDWVNQNKEAQKDNDTMMARLGATNYNNGNAFVMLGTEGSAINISPYVGAYVTAYQNKDNDIIAIKEVKSEFLTGKFTKADFSIFKANGVEYSINKPEDVNAATPTAIFFENGSKNSDTAKKDTEYTIAVDLSGKKVSKIYSVMEWTPKSDMLYTSTIGNNIEKNHKIGSFKFVEDNNNDIDLTAFDLIGVSALNDIKTDNVLYVYANSKNEITRLEVGTEVVSGEITKVKGEGDNAEYTINGKTYELAKTHSSISGMKAGNEVKVHLTYSGKIYKAEILSGTPDKFALAVGGTNPQDNVNDAKLKMFLADKKTSTFVVDTDDVKDYTKALAESFGTKNQIVKYDLNKDSEVNALEVLTRGALNIVTSSTKVNDKGYFKGYEIADDAVIFTVEDIIATDPTIVEVKADSDGDYGVTTKNKLLEVTLSKAIYTLNDDTQQINMMVIIDGATDDDVYGVVSNAYTISDGNSVDMIIDGVEKDNLEASGKYTDKVGDGLYKVSYTASGSVKLGNKETVDETTTGAVTVSNNRVYFGVDSKGKGINNICAVTNATHVYVWNDDKEVWTIGGTADLEIAEKDKLTTELYYLDGDKVAAAVLIFPTGSAI